MKDVDYTLDQSGNPVQTKQGAANVPSTPAWNIGVPLVLYPQAQDAGHAIFSWLQQILPVAVQSAVVGLYSPTESSNRWRAESGDEGWHRERHLWREKVGHLDKVISTWRAGGRDPMRKEYEEALQNTTR